MGEVLYKILEELEYEILTNKEIGRKQCEGMARAMNIIRSHIDDVSNINVSNVAAINREMEDYLFEKYCIEGFDEELDKIFKKYLDLCKDTTIIINDGWIDCKKSMPTKDMDKKPVWIVYGSPMNFSVEFAYCDWTLSEDEYGNDDSYTQFYIPQAPCLYYPSLNLVHYWKPVNIPKFKKE